MKKPLKPSKVSHSPPKGWPSDADFEEAERLMKSSLATKILPSDAGPVQRVKHELCQHFIIYHKTQDISQRELAKRLDVTENRVSEILHYHHESFTIDRLVDLLSRIKPDIRLKVA